MTTKFLYKVSDVKRLIKIGLFIVVLLSVYMFSGRTHANSIEFDDNILGLFPGITGYVNMANFAYGGNDFAGTFFLSNPGYLGETITLNGEDRICTRQVKGLYYNNQRGYRLRPLDKDTLDIIQIANITGYNNLTMSGGWYTLCSGYNPDEVYGLINHNRSGTDYNMIVGVTYDFINNTYTGGLSGTFRFFNNITGYFRDQRGGVANFWGTGVPELTQTGNCIGVVTSGIYYNGSTSYNITQIRDGTIWNPTTSGGYTSTPTSGSCDFKCITGYTRSGASNSCEEIADTCGNGTIESNEECDPNTSTGRACALDCTLKTPSCSAFTFSPTTGYSSLTVNLSVAGQTGIQRALNISKGTSYYTQTAGTGASLSLPLTLTNTGIYNVIFTGSNPFSGGLDCVKTGTITVYDACGNGSIQTGEQCDDNNTTNGDGCSSSCQLETPTCTLTNDSPKYTGEYVTFTGDTNSRAKISNIQFGDGSGVGINGTYSNYTTIHSYTNSGSYTGTIIVTNNITGTIIKTGICTSSVTILGATGAVCGNNIIEGTEQCDDNNTTNGDGCSSSCQLETPTCTLTNNSPKYTGENVTFTGTSSSRSRITEITYGDGIGASVTSNLSNITATYSYQNTGTYTATIITTSNITGTIVKTGSCPSTVTILGATGAICGNNIIEGTEQCDDNNTTNGDGCNSSCQLETPTCTLTNDSPKYTGENVTFTGNSSSRSKITEITYGNGNGASITSNSSNYTVTYSYLNSGTYTATIITTSNITGTTIKTGSCTSTVTILGLTGINCRNGRTNINGTCTLIGTGNITITGTINSGTIFYIPGNIMIYSSGDNTGGYLSISGINSVGISYGNRNGILTPPTILSAGSCSASSNTLTSISSGLTNPIILLEFQAGASGSTITSNVNGGYFTIKVKVNSGTIGDTYRIFRSAECSTGREKTYIDEICILDSNKMCEFRTNKLSYFNIVANSLLGAGSPMIIGTIPRLRNAQIDKAYMSDPFTIANFNDITLATISKGMLYVNGEPIGTSGYVQNGDELNIELYSSKKYDTTISSKITIGSVSTTFYITTMIEGDDNSTDLSNLQKIRIMSIFNLLLELYSDDSAKEEEFLYTLRSMLTDKLESIDEDDDAYSTFEYLLSLIEARLLISGIDESDHVAPNCKEYEIQFEEDQNAYYSPNFKKVQYFSTRSSLIRYIDAKNPGDCRINTYGSNYIDTKNTDPDKHTAPNGKVYTIESDDNGYTSPDLSSTKYFDTLQGLRAYLNLNNPAITIRDHTIDTSFDPINHTSPNNKVYKIYKTDKGYMSYKLMKVRYFNTLESIKGFINQNNKI